MSIKLQEVETIKLNQLIKEVENNSRILREIKENLQFIKGQIEKISGEIIRIKNPEINGKLEELKTMIVEFTRIALT